jgi:Ca2+-binding RTX toxin-like protein
VLPSHLATGVGGTASNIRDVTGGAATNLLVGDGNNDTLTGGSGRNILVAGGRATLVGGDGDDVLIGGQTNYDSNLSALLALMAEWARTDLTYAARVNHLLHGGGLNGATILNGTTVHSNGARNTLTGGDGLDLFFGNLARDVSDSGSSPGEVFVSV